MSFGLLGQPKTHKILLLVVDQLAEPVVDGSGEGVVVVDAMSTMSHAWKKSSRSGTGCCVEVCSTETGHIQVRDSKHPAGPLLTFSRNEWEAFIAGAKDGEFSL